MKYGLYDMEHKYPHERHYSSWPWVFEVVVKKKTSAYGNRPIQCSELSNILPNIAAAIFRMNMYQLQHVQCPAHSRPT